MDASRIVELCGVAQRPTESLGESRGKPRRNRRGAPVDDAVRRARRDALQDLIRGVHRRTYGRGQYLWYQGDEGDRLVIVATGLVKVV